MRSWTIRRRTTTVAVLVIGIAILTAAAVQARQTPEATRGATGGGSSQPSAAEAAEPGRTASARPSAAAAASPHPGASVSAPTPHGHRRESRIIARPPRRRRRSVRHQAPPQPGCRHPQNPPRHHRCCWGASWEGGPSATAAWDRFEAEAGRQVSMVMWFAGFDSSFPKQATSAAVRARCRALITWEPIAPAGKPAANYTFAAIAKGVQDDYLSQWAAGARQLNPRIVIRLAPEMNGDWIPWAAKKPGNSPKDFVAAWRHVVTLFRQHGADRVEWAWVPNVPDPTSVPIATQYPGNDVVDWVGLDGYNWGILRNPTSGGSHSRRSSMPGSRS